MIAVSVPVEAAAFVAGGGRDVDTAKIAVTAEAGARVRLVDPAGDEVGLAVCDPENHKLRVLAVPDDGFRQLDAALLGWRVERALKLRKALGLVGDDHTYRLVHGAGDGLPGFSCDVLGSTAVVWAPSAALRPMGTLLAEAVRGFARTAGAVVKVRARGGSADAADQQDIIGKAPDERMVVTEHGVPFEVHPLGGLNVGLFTDMREQRRGLARFAADRRVLNLFSYSGALSVACARAGAASVTSVDTSAGVQAWASANFGRSGLDPRDARWQFHTGDAVRFLQRAAKDKERYELVLIDPPTFSTARGSPWTIDRDYPELIGKACAVIPSDGLLWLAANTVELGSLLRLVQKGLKLAGRTAAVLEQAGLPPEYPTLLAQPRDRYLQICLLRLA